MSSSATRFVRALPDLSFYTSPSTVKFSRSRDIAKLADNIRLYVRVYNLQRSAVEQTQ